MRRGLPAGICREIRYVHIAWFILWKNTQATEDGYVSGLEPGSSFPNPHGTERKGGRVISLAPKESVTFRLQFEVATDRARVRQILDEVTALQVATPKIVCAAQNLSGFRNLTGRPVFGIPCFWNLSASHSQHASRRLH